MRLEEFLHNDAGTWPRKGAPARFLGLVSGWVRVPTLGFRLYFFVLGSSSGLM
jgi:hypothetical protein